MKPLKQSWVCESGRGSDVGADGNARGSEGVVTRGLEENE